MNRAPLLIPLDAIDIPPNRIRDADPDKVGEIAASFAEVGQLQAIEVLSACDGRYTLNIGLHRYLAARQAGLAQIEARLFDGTAAQARLREIDENLYRAELTPYDQAAHLAERRAIYEALSGPIRAGGDHSANLRQYSFFDQITEKFGLPRRTTERALTRWHRISREVWTQLRGTPVAKNGSYLDAIARLEPADQAGVVAKLLQGEAKTISGALALLHGEAGAEATQAERQVSRLKRTWGGADRRTRLLFIDFLRQTGQLGNTPKRRGK